ncbi:hypothetical protein [Brevibacillus brevis]|uniref:Transposase n=1 Tax=Brevibacillus brevis TaxID=1393 RepID=A0ABY9T2Y6_BREBE|nr:hypothetical protein [Brevibacillus brevis]WNC14254.1 hypothetical protein RGB73_26830 [Brevibacillus brevis]
MMKFQDRTPISVIREEQQESPEQKIARLERELAAEKEDKLNIMEATAQVYEELLALKEQIGGTA